MLESRDQEGEQCEHSHPWGGMACHCPSSCSSPNRYFSLSLTHRTHNIAFVPVHGKLREHRGIGGFSYPYVLGREARSHWGQPEACVWAMAWEIMNAADHQHPHFSIQTRPFLPQNPFQKLLIISQTPCSLHPDSAFSQLSVGSFGCPSQGLRNHYGLCCYHRQSPHFS